MTSRVVRIQADGQVVADGSEESLSRMRVGDQAVVHRQRALHLQTCDALGDIGLIEIRQHFPPSWTSWPHPDAWNRT